MVAFSYNLLTYLDKLTSAGMPETQAKAQMEVLSDVMKMNIEQAVTHNDLKELENRLENKMDKLDAKIDRIYIELKSEIAQLRTELKGMNWLMGFLVAGMSTLLIKAFFA